MARYIDADKLWNDRPQIPEGTSMDYGAGFSECMWGFSKNIRKQIDTESADVVPKSEVEKFAEEIKLEFYREFDEIIPSIMADKIDLLKKKYTEEKKE